MKLISKKKIKVSASVRVTNYHDCENYKMFISDDIKLENVNFTLELLIYIINSNKFEFHFENILFHEIIFTKKNKHFDSIDISNYQIIFENDNLEFQNDIISCSLSKVSIDIYNQIIYI